MIKSCELLEYLTRSHKSPYSVLDVDPLSLKKMVNRDYSNIHVESKQVSSLSQSSSDFSEANKSSKEQLGFQGVNIYGQYSHVESEQY